MSSHTKLLIYGYVRKIENLLVKNVVIPQEIYQICCQFYINDIKYLVLVTGSSWNKKTKPDMNIALLDPSNYRNNKHFKCKIYEWNKSSLFTENAEEFFIRRSPMCFASNIVLPSDIHNKISKKYNKFHHQYHVLFHHVVDMILIIVVHLFGLIIMTKMIKI